MFKEKKGILRKIYYFVIFVIGVILLILLIKYKWDVSEVFEVVRKFIGKE